MTRQPLTLPQLLVIDAATCAAMGVLLAATAGLVAALTAIPAPLLFWAGLLLLPAAGFMTVVARWERIPAWAISLVLLGNAGWALMSIALPLAGVISPNPVGWLFLVAQAGVVVVLTLLERGAATQRPAI